LGSPTKNKKDTKNTYQKKIFGRNNKNNNNNNNNNRSEKMMLEYP
jgi:hypothetical protein